MRYLHTLDYYQAIELVESNNNKEDDRDINNINEPSALSASGVHDCLFGV